MKFPACTQRHAWRNNTDPAPVRKPADGARDTHTIASKQEGGGDEGPDCCVK